jgi:hypothetical protein
VESRSTVTDCPDNELDARCQYIRCKRETNESDIEEILYGQSQFAAVLIGSLQSSPLQGSLYLQESYSADQNLEGMLRVCGLETIGTIANALRKL